MISSNCCTRLDQHLLNSPCDAESLNPGSIIETRAASAEKRLALLIWPHA